MIATLEQEVLNATSKLKALNIYNPTFHVSTDSLIALGNALSLTEKVIIELDVFKEYLENCKNEIVKKIHLLATTQEEEQ